MNVLVYDGDCGVCERFADMARRRARNITVRDHRTHGLASIEAVIYLADGREYAGAPAVARLLVDFDGRPWRLVGRIIALPVMRTIARGVYFVVARNRRRLSRLFGLRACGLPDASADR